MLELCLINLWIIRFLIDRHKTINPYINPYIRSHDHVDNAPKFQLRSSHERNRTVDQDYHIEMNERTDFWRWTFQLMRRTDGKIDRPRRGRIRTTDRNNFAYVDVGGPWSRWAVRLMNGIVRRTMIIYDRWTEFDGQTESDDRRWLFVVDWWRWTVYEGWRRSDNGRLKILNEVRPWRPGLYI